MEKLDEKTNDMDIAVIFEKLKRMDDGVIIHYPIGLELGFFDEETEEFTTLIGSRYPHMIEKNYKYGFGLRTSVEELKEIFKTDDLATLTDLYLTELKRYHYYFTVPEPHYVTLIAENEETNALSEVIETDMEIALNYLTKIGVWDSFDLSEEDESDLSLDDPQENYPANEPTKTPLKTQAAQLTFDAKALRTGIKSEVVGQDNAIDDIVTIIWQNFRSKNSKSNILLIGPSGVGKTEIIRNISKRLNIPRATLNAAAATQTGYVGESVDSALKKLLKDANYDVEKANRGIVFIDEIDKIAGDGTNHTEVVSTGVQDELLKLLEDGEYEIEIEKGFFEKTTYTVNTKNITFICAGAFSKMDEVKKQNKSSIGFASINTTNSINKNNLDYSNKITSEDLVNYGLKPELVGRLNHIIELHSLDKDNLISIMKNPNNTTIQEKVNILNTLGIKINLDDEVYNLLADNALKNNTGARGLISEVDNLFIKAMKEISENQNDYSELIITTDTVKNPKNYTLVKKKK